MEPDIIQLGFLDFDSRLHRIDKTGDPLQEQWDLTILRGVVIPWAKVKIGLRNLAFNLNRYGTLALAQG